ncbi:MAG: tRNA (adenosine(37)-N6)-threonylcarbamoyltransferase complex dimerization subunit type 1 TsaB [Gammaproteobacteria bacterium]|nr:tRNA (adenosine(37)-N6)-threonylcarbamoyltransferase complex dimerization subunit type 1 TsaB [Gammaproteobacteria bacterium]
MANILSIDASTEYCSVALMCGNEVIEDCRNIPKAHALHLLPMVEKLLVESSISLQSLDAIACNIGPGAFTGIRIAVSAAQGLCYGADLPAIPVSTLANLAIQAFNQKDEIKQCLSAIDARMNEVYFARFNLNDNGLPQLIDKEMVIGPEKIALSSMISDGSYLIGNGWNAYQEAFKNDDLSNFEIIQNSYPQAQYSLTIAKQAFDKNEVIKAEDLQPAYLRNNVVQQ